MRDGLEFEHLTISATCAVEGEKSSHDDFCKISNMCSGGFLHSVGRLLHSVCCGGGTRAVFGFIF